jgi:phage baseplate assembly protein W
MADGITYGINFPFVDSYVGKYLDASDTGEEEVRSNLIHLLLTRKGSRYFLPDFGTRLYEYIFEPLDGPTFSEIESEIRESVENYMPGILITNISITDAAQQVNSQDTTYINESGQKEFRTPNIATEEHTAKIKIDYRNTNGAFNSSDFVILNI